MIVTREVHRRSTEEVQRKNLKSVLESEVILCANDEGGNGMRGCSNYDRKIVCEREKKVIEVSRKNKLLKSVRS